VNQSIATQTTKDLLNWCHCELCKQWRNVCVFVNMMLFTQ